MRYWLSLLLLMFAYPLVAQEPPPIAYRFAYMNDNDTNFRDYFIYTIDPANPNAPPQQLPLPDGMYVCSDPSPDGKWLPVCYRDPNAGSVVYLEGLMLMELSTGLIHQVAPYRTDDDDLTGLAAPQWSPDSRYFVWNIVEWPFQSRRGLSRIELYDVQTRQVSTLFSAIDTPLTDGTEFQPVSARGWSPDSTQLAVFQPTCYINLGGSNRCYESTLHVYQFPSMTLHKSIKLPSYASDICGYYPNWSPDNRYLSFVLDCIPMSAGIPFNEVFVWDTETGNLSQLTTYTNPPPDTWTESPDRHRYAGYDLLWQDTDTLLVGADAREIIMGEGLMLDSIVVQTAAYTLPQGEAVLLADTVENNSWSMNPVSGVIASRVLSLTLSKNKMRPLNSDSVTFSTFDGQRLQSVASFPGGCDNLYWSPDGVYLAYAAALSQTDYDGCRNPTRIYLADQAGAARSVSLSGGSYPTLLGWVVAPDASVIEPSFEVGTPTPVPTFGGAG